MNVLPRREIGTSGIQVSVVGLGGNTFGPPRLDLAQTRKVIDAALDHDVNFIDTANIYGRGCSERFIGEALGTRRDRMIIATKFNLVGRGDDSPREWIVQQAEASIRALQTDRIDLYQIHVADRSVSPDDILGALDQLVDVGKVRAIGACNYAAWRMEEALHSAVNNGTVAFQSVQNLYHVLARGLESEVLPWCRLHSTSVLPYNPLAGGFLTLKYRRGEPLPVGTRGADGSPIVAKMLTDTNFDKLTQLESFSSQRGRRVGELAIAWLLANPTVVSVIAGVSNAEQLAENVGAASWALTAEEKREIDLIANGPDGVPDPECPPSGFGRVNPPTAI